MADFDIYATRKKKKIEDVNVAPILDVMFTIIFFLLVATSFEAYTKLTVPPSRVSAAQAKPGDEPPANPRVIVHKAGNGKFNIQISAAGKTPYEKDKDSDFEKLRINVSELVKNYLKKNPSEKTYQLTIESDMIYDVLIQAMDGIRESSEDVVLVAPVDALKGKSLGESVL
jgi:biopolymer transport protein ExbD